MAAVQAAAAAARTWNSKLPLFVGGKSFGSRMSTMAAAEGKLEGVSGLICFGFPLHPAKQPSIKRAEHLAKVPQAILFLQGTRDTLADVDLMRKFAATLPQAQRHFLAGADHSFDVLKSSGRTPDMIIDELVQETRRFIEGR